MTAKTRRVLLYILISLVILTLFTASLTLGRYSGEYESDSDYSGDIEYVVADQVEVHSVEDFFAAINNGYSNIKIADDVDNPLIIMGGVSDVNSDLVIDLNGHEIQRNNREPLLNITQGVRLTIIDSSENQTGSFYNPVGSVLQISGGTLTIAAGSFESGPRSSDARDSQALNLNEYAERLDDDSQHIINWSAPTQAKIDNDDRVSIVYDNDGGYTTNAGMPVIIPHVSSDGAGRGVTVNGNMYFSEESGGYAYWQRNSWLWQEIENSLIPVDTYLYFTIEDETVENTTISADGSADYFYEYYLKPEITDGQVTGYSYAGQPASLTEETPNGFRRVTVYIYQDVKTSANDPTQDGTIPNYAAIQMQEGNLYVRGGTYYSYFGVNNTYCVDATGGYMAVESGDFYAYESSVCVQCDYAVADDNNYLRVTDGTFNSEVGDTVRVNNGRMTIQTVTFNKDASAVPGGDYRDNGSAINIAGGALEILTSAQFNLSGSYMDGISASGAASSVTANNATINFNTRQNQNGSFSATDANSYNRGIFADGGKVVCNGNTSVRMGAENTNRTAQFCYGIYSVNGAITCGTQGSGAQTAVYIYGRTGYTVENYGIATEGGTVSCYGQTGITVYGQQSVGIYSSAAEISENTYSGGEISISGTDFTCEIRMYTGTNTLAENLSGTAISTTGGNITFNVNSATIISDGLGITALNKIYSGTTAGDIIPGSGNVTFETTATSAEIELTTSRGTAMYILGGNVTIDDAITFEVESNTSANYPWQANGTAYSTDGIRIESGSLLSYGTLNITHKGADNDDVGIGENADLDYPIGNMPNIYDSTDAYYAFNIKSFAVRVVGDTSSATATDVTILKGTITNSVGGGLYVSGGSNTSVSLNGMISEDDVNGNGQLDDVVGGDSAEVSINTTGVAAFEKYMHVAGAADNWSTQMPQTGGHSVQVSGGTLNIYNGSYSALLGNGIMVTNGNANVYNGTFVGGDQGIRASNNDLVCGAAASYCLKVCGGTANIYNGVFGSAVSKDQNGNLKESNVSSSGAFIMGTSADSRGEANIYNGTFNVAGQSAFAVYQYATVTFGQQGMDSDIYVRGNAAGMTVEATNSDTAMNIAIYSGVFRGYRETNGNGIWFGNESAVTYIYGGSFYSENGWQGNNNSGGGIRVDNGNVYLAGGVYYGKQRSIIGTHNIMSGYGYSRNGTVAYNYFVQEWNGSNYVTYIIRRT